MALDLVSKLPYDHPYRWDGRIFGSPKLWRPTDIGASLALWLDAEDEDSITLNGSNVSQWNDKSGNDRHTTQATAANQPTYLTTGLNSKPSIQTDGNDSLIIGPNSLGRNVSGITCAIVGLYPVGATLVNSATDVWISTAGGITRFATFPNPINNKYGLGGRRLDSDSFSSVESSTDYLSNRGNPWIRVAQRAYSDGVANHWTNGVQDMTNATLGTQGAGNTSDTNSTNFVLFQNVSTGAQLSEVVLTHSTMTNSDRQKLEGYLAWKWALEANLPSNHPYKSRPPTV